MAPPTKTSCMLATGEYFDHLDPDPAVINIDVLAAGMRQIRFNGQTSRTITTGEHCMRVRRFVRAMGGGDEDQLWALLHDGHEALVPWGDCLGPGKTDEMRAVEARVDAAICAALEITVRPQTVELVKKADEIALYYEAMLWQHGASDWAPFVGPNAVAAVANPVELLPEVAPRPGEDWRTEVEALLGSVRAASR